MNKRICNVRYAISAVALFALATPAFADGGPEREKDTAAARLNGFQEVPAAIFTNGRGQFAAKKYPDRIDYELSYRRLTGDVTAAAGAHIHFGRPGVNGAVLAFLCQGAVAAPSGTPLCVDNGNGNGRVKGTLRDADVLPASDQGFPGGSIRDLWAVIRHRAGYVNLHTDTFPGGEIRGAIR